MNPKLEGWRNETRFYSNRSKFCTISMYWSERSLCDRHHSTIVKLIHAIKKCAFITQLRQQQDYLLSPLTISGMNDIRFHSHQLTRNTVHLSFLGSEPSEMIWVKLLIPKCIKKINWTSCHAQFLKYQYRRWVKVTALLHFILAT